MDSEIWYLDATELARLIRGRELSPVEVVQAHLNRIGQLDPVLHAIATPITEQAIAAAVQAEQQVMRGGDLGPLHGVPFTIKDALNTAGVRTMRGSRIFAGHVPAADATAVARLKAAGAIPIAKTNVPEFAYWTETDNLVTGYARNPWNLERTAGGSSGGEAAAIAAGLSPLGIGSDVAFSVRGPAHYTGIAALKPTHGLIPATGHWPDLPRRYWHLGPMARSVRDLAAALSILSGPDGHDGYARTPRWTAPEHARPRPRVGWLTGPEFGPVDADVAATVQRAARVLAGLQVPVEQVSIPALATNYSELAYPLYAAEVGPLFRDTAEHGNEPVHPVMQAILAMPDPSLADYIDGQHAVDTLRSAMTAYFTGFDVLLCPVSPVTAPLPNQSRHPVNDTTIPAADVKRPTVPFNLTGLPALSLPFGLSRDGMPIGVQLVSAWHQEAAILELGALLEPHSDLRDRRPAI